MNRRILVADIGGTNARLAIYNLSTQRLSHICSVEITQQDSLQSLVQDY